MKIQSFRSALLLFLVFTFSTAFANEGQINDLLHKMKTVLHLSEEQVETIKPIVKENLERRQEVMEGLQSEAVFNKSSYKREMLKLREEENQELSKVLTPEQMKILLNRQHIQDSLNKDQIDFSEGLSTGVSLNPQGGAFQF
jgi:hypothetical protein